MVELGDAGWGAGKGSEVFVEAMIIYPGLLVSFDVVVLAPDTVCDVAFAITFISRRKSCHMDCLHVRASYIYNATIYAHASP